MNRRQGGRAIGVLAALWLVSAALPARADFAAAVADYKAGRHEAAAREFERLAWFGLAPAQSNLALLYAKGEGVQRSLGRAAAWAGISAQDKGPKSRELYFKLLPSLGLADMDEMIALEREYQAVALEDRLDLEMRTPMDVEPKRLTRITDIYPSAARWEGWEGFVYLAVGVDEQGRPQDPRVLIANPPGRFEAATVKALLGARWQPATLQGRPVASNHCLLMIFQFEGEGNNISAKRMVSELRARADGGDVSSQFAGALLWQAYPDAGGRIKMEEAQRWMVGALEAKFPPALMMSAMCDVPPEYGPRAVELARAYGGKELLNAARDGSPPAQIEVARALLAADQLDITARTRRAIGWLELAGMDIDSRSAAQLRLAHVLATTPAAQLRDPVRARSLYESARHSWGFHPLLKETAGALGLSPQR